MSLFQFFSTIKDTRDPRGKIFPLEYILLFSVLAVLSGATGYASIADWINLKEKSLRKVFGLLWVRMPKKSGLQKVFVGLDKVELEKAFRAYSLSLVQSQPTATNQTNLANQSDPTKTNQTNNKPINNKPTKYLQIAVDGKTLKGSYDKLGDSAAINLISVFLTGKNIVLAQIGVENKESEMAGVRDLLGDEKLMEDLKSIGVKVITMDALHCQKKH
jgi:DDE_Tnp_1-associated